MAIDLNDKTANGNTLTNINGVTEVTSSLPFAQSTSAADFENTSSQYLSITDAAQTGLDLATTFTIEAWVKPESAPLSGDTWYIVSKDDFTNRSYSFFYRNAGGTLRLTASALNTTNEDAYHWDIDLGTGTWKHLALTCDVGQASATTFELFLNAVSQGNGSADSSANISSITNSSAIFAIGSGGDLASIRYFDGQMDEVRIWNDIRTSTEISDNYNVELIGNETNLVAYYPFEALAISVNVAPYVQSATFSQPSPYFDETVLLENQEITFLLPQPTTPLTIIYTDKYSQKNTTYGEKY